MTRRCQGCGGREGEQRMVRDAPRARFYLATVRLHEFTLADFGPGLFCDHCRRSAKRLNREFRGRMYRHSQIETAIAMFKPPRNNRAATVED